MPRSNACERPPRRSGRGSTTTPTGSGRPSAAGRRPRARAVGVRAVAQVELRDVLSGERAGQLVQTRPAVLVRERGEDAPRLDPGEELRTGDVVDVAELALAGRAEDVRALER